MDSPRQYFRTEWRIPIVIKSGDFQEKPQIIVINA
jgi:hypothetical protein